MARRASRPIDGEGRRVLITQSTDCGYNFEKSDQSLIADLSCFFQVRLLNKLAHE